MTTPHIFLIEQETHRLYGDYLTHAIVVAEREADAIEAAIHSCAASDKLGEDDPICVFRSRLTVTDLAETKWELSPTHFVDSEFPSAVLVRAFASDNDQVQSSGDEQAYYHDEGEEPEDDHQ